MGARGMGARRPHHAGLMAAAAIIAIEHVLSDGTDLKSAPPTKWGKPLYDSLRSQFRVLLLSSHDRQITKFWLRKEGFVGMSALMCHRGIEDYESWKVSTVRDALADGWEVAFYLDKSQPTLGHVFALGVRTLAVSYPPIRPSWSERDLGPPREWSSVVAKVEGEQEG
jgi:hypothetical protein